MNTTRAWRSLIACLTALMVFGQVLTGVPTATAADGPAPDFAGLAIRPSDLTEPGFGRFTGRGCANAAGCAEALFPNGGPDEATLKSAKVRRGYYAGLSEPEAINAGDPADTIETTILEFADSSKAKAGLELLLGPLADLAEPAASDVAPGAQLFVTDLPAEDGSQFTGAAGVRFRSGRLVISVDRRFAGGAEIDSAAVEALAGIIVDRIENPSDVPGLGSLMLHQLNSSFEAYDFIDRAIQPTYSGFGSIDQERADFYTAAGAVDIYMASQDLLKDLMGYSTVSLSTTLARFKTADDATGFIPHWIDRLTSAGITVRDIEGAAELGDASTAIVVAYGSTYSVQYIVQVGTIAAVISWDNYIPSSLSLDELVADAQARFGPMAQFTAEHQTECVQTGACPGMVAIPDNLVPQQ